MFDRKQLKANAKVVVKRFYWLAVLVSFLVAIVSGTVSTSVKSSTKEEAEEIFNTDSIAEAITNSLIGYGEENFEALDGNIDNVMESFGTQLEQWTPDEDALSGSTSTAASGVLIIALAVAGIISIAWSFLIAAPAEIGQSRFYLASRENQQDFKYVFYAFKNNYIKNAWASFSTKIIVGLWALLAAVPGILGSVLAGVTGKNAFSLITVCALPLMVLTAMKYYQYSMVNAVLANNSELNGKTARELSTKLTNGHKWDLFVLDLSFIGWFILAVLCCGIGVFFLLPYYIGTKAEAYTCLKADAVNKNNVDSAELPSFVGAIA